MKKDYVSIVDSVKRLENQLENSLNELDLYKKVIALMVKTSEFAELELYVKDIYGINPDALAIYQTDGDTFVFKYLEK